MVKMKVLAVLLVVATAVLATKPPGYVETPKPIDKDPPKYNYGYTVSDEKGSQGHSESRDGIYARGRFYVDLPQENAKQDVKYFADDWGYHPLVKYSEKTSHSSVHTHLAFGEEAVKALNNQGPIHEDVPHLPQGKEQEPQHVIKPHIPRPPLIAGTVLPVPSGPTHYTLKPQPTVQIQYTTPKSIIGQVYSSNIGNNVQGGSLKDSQQYSKSNGLKYAPIQQSGPENTQYIEVSQNNDNVNYGGGKGGQYIADNEGKYVPDDEGKYIASTGNNYASNLHEHNHGKFIINQPAIEQYVVSSNSEQYDGKANNEQQSIGQIEYQSTAGGIGQVSENQQIQYQQTTGVKDDQNNYQISDQHNVKVATSHQQEDSNLQSGVIYEQESTGQSEGSSNIQDGGNQILVESINQDNANQHKLDVQNAVQYFTSQNNADQSFVNVNSEQSSQQNYDDRNSGQQLVNVVLDGSNKHASKEQQIAQLQNTLESIEQSILEQEQHRNKIEQESYEQEITQVTERIPGHSQVTIVPGRASISIGQSVGYSNISPEVSQVSSGPTESYYNVQPTQESVHYSTGSHHGAQINAVLSQTVIPTEQKYFSHQTSGFDESVLHEEHPNGYGTKLSGRINLQVVNKGNSQTNQVYYQSTTPLPIITSTYATNTVSDIGISKLVASTQNLVSNEDVLNINDAVENGYSKAQSQLYQKPLLSINKNPYKGASSGQIKYQQQSENEEISSTHEEQTDTRENHGRILNHGNLEGVGVTESSVQYFSKPIVVLEDNENNFVSSTEGPLRYTNISPSGSDNSQQSGQSLFQTVSGVEVNGLLQQHQINIQQNQAISDSSSLQNSNAEIFNNALYSTTQSTVETKVTTPNVGVTEVQKNEDNSILVTPRPIHQRFLAPLHAAVSLVNAGNLDCEQNVEQSVNLEHHVTVNANHGYYHKEEIKEPAKVRDEEAEREIEDQKTLVEIQKSIEVTQNYPNAQQLVQVPQPNQQYANIQANQNHQEINQQQQQQQTVQQSQQQQQLEQQQVEQEQFQQEQVEQQQLQQQQVEQHQVEQQQLQQQQVEQHQIEQQQLQQEEVEQQQVQQQQVEQHQIEQQQLQQQQIQQQQEQLYQRQQENNLQQSNENVNNIKVIDKQQDQQIIQSQEENIVLSHQNQNSQQHNVQHSQTGDQNDQSNLYYTVEQTGNQIQSVPLPNHYQLVIGPSIQVAGYHQTQDQSYQAQHQAYQQQQQQQNYQIQQQGYQLQQQHQQQQQQQQQQYQQQYVNHIASNQSPVQIEKVVDRPVPYPVEVERVVQKEVHVPYQVNNIVEKQVPVPYPVERVVEKQVAVPYEVEKKVPYPVEVEKIVEKPYPVEKIVDRPIQVPVHIPYPVEKRVPYPVEKVVEKIIDRPVEVTKYVNKPYSVDRFIDRPVAVPYPVEKRVPYAVEKIVEKQVRVPYPVEKIVDRPVHIPYPVEKIVEKQVAVPYAVHIDRIVEKPYPVEKIIDRPIHIPYAVEKIVDRPVHIPYPVEKIVEKKVPYKVEVERIVEKPYPVEKIVEKEVRVPYPVEKIVDRPVHIPYPVEKIVQKNIPYPVHVEKIVEKEVRVPYPVEKIVEKIVNRPVHVPYPVDRVVEKHVNVPYPVERVVEKIVDRPVHVPYPVEKQVLVEKQVNVPVPYAVEKTVGVPYAVKQVVNQPVAVPYAVEVTKFVDRPIYITLGSHDQDSQIWGQNQLLLQQVSGIKNPWGLAAGVYGNSQIALQEGQYNSGLTVHSSSLTDSKTSIVDNNQTPWLQNYPISDFPNQKYASNYQTNYAKSPSAYVESYFRRPSNSKHTNVLGIKNADYFGPVPPASISKGYNFNSYKYRRNASPDRSRASKNLNIEYGGFKPPLVPSIELDSEGLPKEKTE